MAKFDVSKHMLVPKHVKIGETERKKLFERYSIELKNLPRINQDDPAISQLNLKEGDVVKITRDSSTAGTAIFYRRVVSK